MEWGDVLLASSHRWQHTLDYYKDNIIFCHKPAKISTVVPITEAVIT